MLRLLVVIRSFKTLFYETIVAAVLGAIITIFFLRGMYLVLTFASKTYGLEDKDTNNSTENSLLFLGLLDGFLVQLLLLLLWMGMAVSLHWPILCLLGLLFQSSNAGRFKAV